MKLRIGPPVSAGGPTGGMGGARFAIKLLEAIDSSAVVRDSLLSENTESGIMAIEVHPHAEADLEAFWVKQPEAAAGVVSVLEQIEADPGLLDKLTQRGDNQLGRLRVNVKRWQRVRPRPGDLWRLRILDTPATSYRVVYGYHMAMRRICVLAVVHKQDFDYDDLTSAIAQRILDDWASF